jgi:hypothetical protein
MTGCYVYETKTMLEWCCSSECAWANWRWMWWKKGKLLWGTGVRIGLILWLSYGSLIGDFNPRVYRDDIFKRTICNENWQETGNGNWIKAINTEMSEYLALKSTMFLQRKIHEYSWTFQTKREFYHFLVKTCIFLLISFRWAYCDNGRYFMVAEFMIRLSVSEYYRHLIRRESEAFRR